MDNFPNEAQNMTTENRDKLRKAIQEISNSMTRMASERDFIKEVVKNVSEELQLEKKLVRRMGKSYYNGSFSQDVVDDEDFASTYEQVINGQITRT